MVIFFLSYCLLFNKITLNKGSVGTNHLNNRILLFVCNRKVIYYYYITLPTITITITFGNFQSITITITLTSVNMTTIKRNSFNTVLEHIHAIYVPDSAPVIVHY